MKFRKKPVVIEAVLLSNTLQSIHEVQKFIQNGSIDTASCQSAVDAWDNYQDMVKQQGGIKIKTLEGTMLAAFGDHVIKGIKGEFYPCKSDIFEATYDLVTD